jgi:hypothetical protein
MLWIKNKEKHLQELLDKMTIQRDMYKARCLGLENGVEKDFGVKIRQEITEVKVAFTLMELTVLYTALCKLMERPLITEDLEYYLKLRLKLEELMRTVKE